MRKEIRMLLITMVFWLFFYEGVAGHAEEKTGSITLTMRDGGQIVSGGTVSIYQVGRLTEKEGTLCWEAVGRFQKWQDQMKQMHPVRLAEELTAYAEKNDLEGITAELDRKGSVQFKNLQPGLYLLVQKEAAEGYLKTSPFLAAVPLWEDGRYVYEIDASPKVELKRAESGSDVSEYSSDPGLPQTGQSNWPIPLLTVLGMLVFTVGWLLRTDENEEYSVP